MQTDLLNSWKKNELFFFCYCSQGDTAQIRAAIMAAKQAEMERRKYAGMDEETRRKAEKEDRLRKIEAKMFEELAKDHLEVLQQRNREKAVSVG